MVSAKLGSRLGVVKSTKLESPSLSSRIGGRVTPPPRNKPIMNKGLAKNMFGHLQSHLSAEKKTFKPTKTDSSPKERKSPVTAAVSKKGSRIQVVSNTKSPRSRSPIRSLSSRTGSSMPKLGGMRCDMEEHQTKKPAIQRTNVSRSNISRSNLRGLENMTFKVESKENEYIGIDLKKVSLKRKIKNDDSTTEMGGLGEIKRTVANKREKAEQKRHSSDEEMVPKKSSRSVTEKEKGRAIYKTALNDLMENRKKTKMDNESRKRMSRDKMRKMKEKGDSSDSDSPVPSPKRKKPSKKAKKVTSSEESESEQENVTRRPGERGKSAIKDIHDDGDDDTYSPIEGYRLKVSNLNSSVSESDLVDLFCAIGAIRDAKLSADPGSAIITFVKRAAAMAAITKYNGRELDKQKISVTAHRVMDLPPKKPYQWRNEYPTKKPRVRQELVGEISHLILPPALAGIVQTGAKPVVFTVKV